MAYNLNLGAWGSVFAVPSVVVDEHIKIASAYHLKVLLYLLKNNNTPQSDETIASALGMHTDDVKDCLSFWVERKVISVTDEVVTPHKEEPKEETTVTAFSVPQPETEEKPKRKLPSATRPVRPEPGYVLKCIASDPEVAVLMDEAQLVFGRLLSNAEIGTLVMLRDTYGLPVDVIIMLMQYCADNNKATLAHVEKIGIQWGLECINTMALAEEKIRQMTQSYSNFNRVSTTFGLKNAGSPTKKQLEFATTWVSTWSFSDDMLRFAYEKCVDAKGTMNMSYINKILEKWYMAGWKNPDEVKDEAKEPAKKSAKKSSKPAEIDTSYDIEAYENKSIFD